jgi:hypothetical protein
MSDDEPYLMTFPCFVLVDKTTVELDASGNWFSPFSLPLVLTGRNSKGSEALFLFSDQDLAERFLEDCREEAETEGENVESYEPFPLSAARLLEFLDGFTDDDFTDIAVDQTSQGAVWIGTRAGMIQEMRGGS